MHPTTRLAARPLLAAALLLLPGLARANAFALDLQGVRANATAGAAAGEPGDPAVQFVNPAALAALDGTRVTAGGMLVYPSAPFTDGGSTLAVGGEVPGAKSADGATSGAAPWLFASHRLSDALTVGLGLTTPFGLATDFGRDAGFVGRYQGIESRIESLAFGPAVAWSLSDTMALGAAVSARRDHVVQSVALDLGSACVGALGDPGACAAAPYGLVPGATDGYGRFEGEGWSWTTTLGATLEPAEGTSVGIAWRHEVKGDVRGDETFELPPGAASFFADVAGNPNALTGSRAGMKLALPDFVTLHGSRALGPVKVVAALQWSRWSPFDEVVLQADSEETGSTTTSEQRYRDAWRFALGADWTVRPGVAVFAGAAFEQSPIRDAYRQATLPETDSILFGLGGDVALGAGFSVAAAWQHVEPTETATIDYLDPTTGARVVGTADTRADLVLAQVTFRR